MQTPPEDLSLESLWRKLEKLTKVPDITVRLERTSNGSIKIMWSCWADGYRHSAPTLPELDRMVTTLLEPAPKPPPEPVEPGLAELRDGESKLVSLHAALTLLGK